MSANASANHRTYISSKWRFENGWVESCQTVFDAFRLSNLAREAMPHEQDWRSTTSI